MSKDGLEGTGLSRVWPAQGRQLNMIQIRGCRVSSATDPLGLKRSSLLPRHIPGKSNSVTVGV